MGLVLKIAKLVQSRAIVDEEGRPQSDFIRTINDNLTQLEKAVIALDGFQEDLALQQALIIEALETAGIAVSTAAEALAAAEEANASIAMANSYTSPGAILSSYAVGGTSVEIAIANHNRIYGGGTSVAVTGTTITGLSPETRYYIFYNDAARAGGAVTFQTSTNYLDAGQTAEKHSCGSIKTPALTATDPIYEGGPRPPGTGGYDGDENKP